MTTTNNVANEYLERSPDRFIGMTPSVGGLVHAPTLQLPWQHLQQNELDTSGR
ncbi:hypothetical protein NG895_17180 [Aeoliella sp. ICT_H6.2]|uniref:Uncharacterized protein n=1 Tax=Aeoliella straminimaris TaxID=2954799 RepID=A0A9X2FCE3_9BACT|nr:hypothetical protein [Aeoliella straminimaris]MCO6045633.1 hypothetical protein [Aeoliella straminimaris]